MLLWSGNREKSHDIVWPAGEMTGSAFGEMEDFSMKKLYMQTPNLFLTVRPSSVWRWRRRRESRRRKRRSANGSKVLFIRCRRQPMRHCPRKRHGRSCGLPFWNAWKSTTRRAACPFCRTSRSVCGGAPSTSAAGIRRGSPTR